MEEVTGREAKLAAAFCAFNVGGGPRQRVALEVKNSHVGRDLSADPTAKDWRGNTGSATPLNRGEVAGDRGGSRVGSFP